MMNFYDIKKRKKYIKGFLISLILSIMPFLCILQNITNKNFKIFFIITCSTIQILTHLSYFFNLNFKLKNRWDTIAFIFSFIIISIIIIGSVWIMHHLNKMA